MNWIPASETKPPVELGAEFQTSIRVLTYSKDWGMRFGYYHRLAEKWTIDGVSSPLGIPVEYWMEVKPPTQ